MRSSTTVYLVRAAAVTVLLGSVSAANTSSLNSPDGQAKQIHFRGRVVDTQGAPIEGARVRFYELINAGTVYSRDSNLAGDVTTGSDGKFSFSTSAKSEGYRYSYIVAEKGKLAIGLANWRMTENQETEIRLDPAKQLAGLVVDQNGKPVSEARVSILMLKIGKGEERRELASPVSEKVLSVITDDVGKFNIGRIPAGATVEFLVKKEGRATIGTFDRSTYRGAGFQYQAGQKDITLTLITESCIKGTVVERATGRPVGKAKLMILDERNRPLPGLEAVLSNENGTFIIDALPPGKHLVKYMPPDDGPVDWVAEPTYVTLAAGETATDVKVELTKGAVLEVYVADAETQKPVEGVRVSVYDQRRREHYSAKTGRDGVGRIRLLPGTYRSGYGYKQGFTRIQVREPITVIDDLTKHLEWKLTALPSITGILRDQNGKPVEGALLSILPTGTREDIISDAKGKYRASWDPGRFSDRRQVPLLVCRHTEGNLGAVAIIPEGKQTLDVELKPAVTVRGQVVDPDGQGITNASIRIMLRQTMWSSTMTRDSATTDADGNFEIRAIPVEHRYELQVNAEGYGGKEIEFHADDAVNSVLEVEPSVLPRANLSVSGLIVDTQGEPLANASIDSYGFGGGQPDHLETHSDSKGRFTLDGVCEGKVDLRVDALHSGKRLSARAKAYGGATGIKLVAREGRAVLQYFGKETYEEIVRSNEKAIAGVAVDESGSPVPGVPVGVCCHKRLRENGKFSWMFSSFSDLKATTDKQGRFAIPIKEDGEYNLLFSPDNHAAVIVYDIPVGKKDLKVTLSAGGTVTGRLVRMDRGKKVPIPKAEVKIEQPDRASYTHLGFDRDRTTTTDSEGRFSFEHLRTKIRPHGSMSKEQWSHIPRVWQISYGETSKTMEFVNTTEIDDFELLVEPGLPQTVVGSTFPGFDGIKIDLAADFAKGKMLLVCFFDMQQRPSRAYLRQLNAKTPELKAKSVAVVAVQTSRMDEVQLDDWCKQYNVSFPVGIIQDDERQIRSIWGVRSLPWLILTDREHIVKADGFSIAEIDKKFDRNLKH